MSARRPSPATASPALRSSPCTAERSTKFSGVRPYRLKELTVTRVLPRSVYVRPGFLRDGASGMRCPDTPRPRPRPRHPVTQSPRHPVTQSPPHRVTASGRRGVPVERAEGEPQLHPDVGVVQVGVEEAGDTGDALAHGVAVDAEGGCGAVPTAVQHEPVVQSGEEGRGAGQRGEQGLGVPSGVRGGDEGGDAVGAGGAVAYQGGAAGEGAAQGGGGMPVGGRQLGDRGGFADAELPAGVCGDLAVGGDQGAQGGGGAGGGGRLGAGLGGSRRLGAGATRPRDLGAGARPRGGGRFGGRTRGDQGGAQSGGQ